jgi:hypothetical protein
MNSKKLLNLRCDGIQLWGDKQTTRRLNDTKRFIGQGFQGESVLDCGGANRFGQELAKELNLVYHATAGDLNKDWTGADKIGVVFCFEVIEHLMNPLLFLSRLAELCHEKTKIYMTYPRTPRWLMSDRHFHEFRDIEFRTLVDSAGFEIVKYEARRNRYDWTFYLSGFRPFIRFWVMILGQSNIHYYCLKMKNGYNPK